MQFPIADTRTFQSLAGRAEVGTPFVAPADGLVTSALAFCGSFSGPGPDTWTFVLSIQRAGSTTLADVASVAIDPLNPPGPQAPLVIALTSGSLSLAAGDVVHALADPGDGQPPALVAPAVLLEWGSTAGGDGTGPPGPPGPQGPAGPAGPQGPAGTTVVVGGGTPGVVRPFSARMFPDTVTAYPATWGTDDDAGTGRADGIGPALACSVQWPTDTRLARRDVDKDFGAVVSTTDYTVLFPSDPGIPTADCKLVWTAHSGVALAAPVVMTSKGPARPPSGLRARWTVDCESRT